MSEIGRIRTEAKNEPAPTEQVRLPEPVATQRRSSVRTANLDGVRGQLIGVVAACSGRIDGTDIATDGRLDELRRLLQHHAEFQAPRSRSLTPFEGESPPTVRSVKGGWIGGGHPADSYDPEQPPRIEAPR